MYSICAIVFVLTIGTGMVAPLLAPYSQSLGANGLWIGFIYSGFYMVRFIIGGPIGRLADRWGPKWILVISMSIYPFIAISYFFADSLLALMGARLLHGLASAMLLPMAMTYIGEITPKGKEGTYMGIYNTILFLANGVGPIIGGVIADWWGIKEAFFILFVLAIITLFLTITSLTSTREETKSSPLKTLADVNTNKSRQSLLKNGKVISLSCIYFTSAVLTMLMVSFFPLYGLEIGFSTLQIGILIAIFNITVGVFQIPFGKMVDRYEKSRLLLVSSVGLAMLFFLMPSIKGFGLLCLFIFLFSIITAISLASSSAIASETGRYYGMGRVMGFLSSATSLGMVIGPLGSGIILDYTSGAWLFIIIGSGWLLSSILLIWNNKKQRWVIKNERIFSNNNS